MKLSVPEEPAHAVRVIKTGRIEDEDMLELKWNYPGQEVNEVTQYVQRGIAKALKLVHSRTQMSRINPLLYDCTCGKTHDLGFFLEGEKRA